MSETFIGYIVIIIGVAFYFFSKKKKKLSPEEIEAQKRKAIEEKALQAKLAKEQQKRAQELIKTQKEREKKIISELINSNERVYFSYSFVSVKSDLYLINSLNNKILESSKTCAENLYKEGFKIVDIDKTGKSAQLESFNFVIRFSKINKDSLKLPPSPPTTKRKKLPPPPPPTKRKKLPPPPPLP